MICRSYHDLSDARLLLEGLMQYIATYQRNKGNVLSNRKHAVFSDTRLFSLKRAQVDVELESGFIATFTKLRTCS